MDTCTLPSLFVSHGSPMTAIESGASGDFWRRLGAAIDSTFGRPRAIVALSAHSLTRELVQLAAPHHTTVHDFGGFPDELYRLRYDAPGAPDLAPRVHDLLTRAGIASHVVDDGGLDHGIWVPLRFAYPDADVPVLPLAWVPTDPPAAQFALGQALAPLAAEGVLVLGTGSITHNLRLLGNFTSRGNAVQPERAESAAFRDWFVQRSAARDWDALFDYRRQAPHGVLMHPTDEHLLPWFGAAGAGGREHAPRRVFADVTYGAIGMDVYAFGPSAAALAAALERVNSPSAA
jgi:4,5-DOPA dioxygenase extradiol